MTVTGDDRTDTLVPLATQLVGAVHEHDEALIAWLLDGADLRGLVVVLAAMAPDDVPPRELLAWLAKPGEYRRLREAGVSTQAACGVIAGSMAAERAAAGV